eukprot:scaffold3401_cov109-Isochrysis_galbana.AAC.4
MFFPISLALERWVFSPEQTEPAVTHTTPGGGRARRPSLFLTHRSPNVFSSCFSDPYTAAPSPPPCCRCPIFFALCTSLFSHAFALSWRGCLTPSVGTDRQHSRPTDPPTHRTKVGRLNHL